MDINMPIIDGYQSSSQIRQFESSLNIQDEKIYIVALTAYSTKIFKDKCERHSIDDFIVKPVSLE